MRATTVEAFAKINLSLKVLGQRADGFHEVRTVLHTIDLSDRIRCVARPGPFKLQCRADGVPEDRTNLVWRAAEALWQASGRTGELRGVTITVTKRIPVRAGLGGGSSDAAATLRALARLWRLQIPHAGLASIAATLGADVPFFLLGGAALGLGRGDETYPLADLPRWWSLIVIPPFGVATTDAYAWNDEDRQSATPGPVTASPNLAGGLASTWLGRLPDFGNDLELPVARRHPAIGGGVEALRQRGALLAGMSGSGSAVFGLFPSKRAATAAGRRFEPLIGWRTFMVRLLPRASFDQRARSRA